MTNDDANELFVLFVLLGLIFVTAHAATIEDSAKAEGEVVLYSSLNNEQIVTLVDAFKKKYPNIKPSFYRGTSERVLQRAVTEAKAGRFAVDVVTSAGFQVQLMKESGTDAKIRAAGSIVLQRRLQRSRTVTGSASIRCSIRWPTILSW